jgi:hypothetical protein
MIQWFAGAGGCKGKNVCMLACVGVEVAL